MNEQRLQLDLTWKQVALSAGMTEFHMQRIRSGKVGLTDRAAAKIDRSLSWEIGTAKAIYEGRERPARKEHSPPTVPPIPAGVQVDPADWAVMTPQERADYIRIVTGVRRRRQGARGA
jgi:hypothetical protein